MSDYKVQKVNKPPIDELVSKLTDIDMRNGLYHLLEFTNSIKMKPQWYAANSYNFNFKGKRVFRLRVNPYKTVKMDGVPYSVGMYLYLSDWSDINYFLHNQSDDFVKSFIDYMPRCRSCYTCAPGFTVSVRENVAENICKNAAINFIDPTPDKIEYGKRLIELQRAFLKTE